MNMGKYGNAQHKEAARASRAFNKGVNQDRVYTPPPREDCDTYDYSYVLEEDKDLQITIRVWYQKGLMTEFYATVELIDGNNVIESLASMDCRNHGSIHTHNDAKDPEHNNFETIYVINSASDIDAYFNRAIDFLTGYAVSIAGTRR